MAMTAKDLQREWTKLEVALGELRVRIRRYSIDPRLLPPDQQPLRDAADEAWKAWMDLRKAFYDAGTPTEPLLRDLEATLLEVDRKADLLQRALISEKSLRTGMLTVGWLAVVLVGLVVAYLALHQVRWGDFSRFEPMAEWGPLKYVEVAFWGTFGALCALLYFAATYLLRRDFDEWFRGWYVATLLRAPFFCVIMMMLVLEFVEWYGEDTWIQHYLLEEGNKFYFIAFMSFTLGLMIRGASDIVLSLGEGVLAFVGGVVDRVSRRLSSALSRADVTGK